MARKEDRPKPYPKAIHGVPGHLSRKEANFLYDTPERIGAGTYLEVGTYEGRSSLCMASGMKDNNIDAHLITIDAFDLTHRDRMNKEGEVAPKYERPGRFEEVAARFEDKGYVEQIELIRGFSVDVAEKYQESFQSGFVFIFIDADHSYAGCKSDFETWSPMLKSGGEMAFHDTNLPEIDRVIAESGWEVVKHIGTIKVIRKP
jgi:predicted O-methyltransferase YrrM